jgi:c-di-GMP-binding flagellar brake protein YcgR
MASKMHFNTPNKGISIMIKFTQNNQSTLHKKMGVLAIERRRHPRFSTELPLNYSRVDGKEIYGGIVANASEGGVLAYLPERMEIGAMLQIEVLYVKGLELDAIQAIAKVVWSDLFARENWGEHRYGLQFQCIDEKDFGRFMALLKG